jgi:hypothetical protein
VDRDEAARLLRRELADHARRPYLELTRLVGEVEAYGVVGADGVPYQIELEAHWVSKPGGPIQVLGGIDDGTFRGALHPVTDGFLVGPDETAGAGVADR